MSYPEATLRPCLHNGFFCQSVTALQQKTIALHTNFYHGYCCGYGQRLAPMWNQCGNINKCVTAEI